MCKEREFTVGGIIYYACMVSLEDILRNVSTSMYMKKNYKPHVETGVSLLNIHVPGPPLWCSPCLLWN